MYSIQAYQKGATDWMEALEMKSGFDGMNISYKGEKLPLYPKILFNFGSQMDGTKQIGPQEVYKTALDEFKDLEKNGGGLYPFYQGLELKQVEASGKKVNLPNGIEVPFLPILSVGGILKEVKNNSNSPFVNLEIELKDGKSITIAVLPSDAKKSGDDIKLFATSVWHDKENLPPEGKLFYTEEVSPRYNASRLNTFDNVIGRGDKFLTNDELYLLNGTEIFAGYQIGDDYARCDTSVEGGGYSHPQAWNLKDGTPFLDALYIVDTTQK